MERFKVTCCKVAGYGQSASVVVSDVYDYAWFSFETEDERMLTFDGEFRHLEAWCKENGLTYVEKEVEFDVEL